MGDLSGVGHINILSHVNSEILQVRMKARADQSERITAGECPILQDTDGDIAKVLSHHGLLPIEEIVTVITDFIPADDVKLCRKYLFESAKGVYYESLEYENQVQTVTLLLKSRRGITARATRAWDVVQLFRYISGFVNTFPRDLLAAAQCPVHTQTQFSYQSETTNTQNDEHIYKNDMTPGGGQADMDISRPITELADCCRDDDRAILDMQSKLHTALNEIESIKSGLQNNSISSNNINGPTQQSSIILSLSSDYPCPAQRAHATQQNSLEHDALAMTTDNSFSSLPISPGSLTALFRSTPVQPRSSLNGDHTSSTVIREKSPCTNQNNAF